MLGGGCGTAGTIECVKASGGYSSVGLNDGGGPRAWVSSLSGYEILVN